MIRTDFKQLREEDEIPSDIQQLFLGGPLKICDSQKLANSDDTTQTLGKGN